MNFTGTDCETVNKIQTCQDAVLHLDLVKNLRTFLQAELF
jgi:hypothetical protein